MRLVDYLKDKIISILVAFLAITSIIILLILFDVNIILKIYIPLIFILSYLIILLYNFNRKKGFYNNFYKTLFDLDKKYLITEIIRRADFLEGNLLLDYLYEIDKSMHENINLYKYNSEEFQEYIELWCHEIKTPIATSKLIIENNYNDITNNILEEIDKIDNYIEQVLYYSRSENVEKDYIISKIDLKNVVENVIKKNKKDLLSKKIRININDQFPFIDSDAKWLEFIINQIISNSIKYSKNKDGVIDIYTKTNKNNILLMIEDNGIGIEDNEINKVFEKGFTGSNGRKKYNSTGIGLYLCKKLCLRLGHDIFISSKINERTTVTIVFPNNSLITELK